VTEAEKVRPVHPRVLIADDHQVIRVAVREALEQGGCVVCAEAENAYLAVDLAHGVQPDVCLIDINMPGGGLWALKEIQDSVDPPLCIMLTVSEAAADLLTALDAGAVGYLLKDVPPAEIPRAVRLALAGDAVLNVPMMTRALHNLRGSSRPSYVTNAEGRRVSFTSREWDALALLVTGMSTSEIAARLDLRPITVRRHISDGVNKLRVPSRADAVELLRRQFPALPQRPPQ
jgi:DNA-binding NarL/FixJ family response regulator